MAKIVITLQDDFENENVDVGMEFGEPIKEDTENTPALLMALDILDFLKEESP